MKPDSCNNDHYSLTLRQRLLNAAQGASDADNNCRHDNYCELASKSRFNWSVSLQAVNVKVHDQIQSSLTTADILTTGTGSHSW